MRTRAFMREEAIWKKFYKENHIKKSTLLESKPKSHNQVVLVQICVILPSDEGSVKQKTKPRSVCLTLVLQLSVSKCSLTVQMEGGRMLVFQRLQLWN